MSNTTFWGLIVCNLFQLWMWYRQIQINEMMYTTMNNALDAIMNLAKAHK